MADLIDRQAALKKLAVYIHLIDKTMGKGTLTDDDCMESAKSVLGEDELPAVQPNHTADIGKKAEKEDCISRQMAIDALWKALDELDVGEWIGHRIFVQNMNDIDRQTILNLPTAQPEPHWIPCSERVPERADNVIICYKAGDYTLVSTGRYLHKFKMWYVDVVGDLRDGVTAWMPLPEPYRGGEQDDR